MISRCSKHLLFLLLCAPRLILLRAKNRPNNKQVMHSI